jgi:hypothetical protein
MCYVLDFLPLTFFFVITSFLFQQVIDPSRQRLGGGGFDSFFMYRAALRIVFFFLSCSPTPLREAGGEEKCIDDLFSRANVEL